MIVIEYSLIERRVGFMYFISQVGNEGMVYAIINNAPTPELTGKVHTNVALLAGITPSMLFFGCGIKRKKDCLKQS